MKVLFAGLGSAGQRHLRNIIRLYGEKVVISAYRSSDNQTVYSEDLKVIPNIMISEVYPIKELRDYDEALNEKPDAVYICNPNNYHVEYALKAIRAGTDVFIEKPLSVDMNGVDKLEGLSEERGRVVYIGYQQRLNPCIKLIKGLINNNTYGKVVDVYAEIGEDVTRMHPYQDFGTMVEVRKDMGGGVVSCQCHEIDYIQYLFGMPEEVLSIGGKRSDKDIDVEDTATSLLRYEDEKGSFAVTIHQDYFQFPASRKIRVIFEKATVSSNLINFCTLIDEDNGTHKIVENKKITRNDLFLEEDRLFIEAVKNRREPFVSLKDGINDLRIIMAIKESINSGITVKIKDM